MNEMTSTLASTMDVGSVIKQMLILLGLCSTRLFAAYLVLPATSDNVMQGGVRHGMCLVFGWFVAWGQPVAWIDGLSPEMLLMLALKEALVGLLIGFAAATVFWIAEGAGAMIDNVAGFNHVQQTNPLHGEESTPVSNLMTQLAIAGFHLLGGMMVLLGVLFESHRWWPLAELTPATSPLLEKFVQLHVSHLMESVAKLAAPVLLVLVLIELGFGVISKSADKLEPSSLAQPVKTTVTLVMLSLLVALFFEQARPALGMQDLARDVRQWIEVTPRSNASPANP